MIVPDRDSDGKGELIALITTITDPRQASRSVLAQSPKERRTPYLRTPEEESP